ncbi:hypothetical protein [Carnimonas bestiolae]|uniref:hypothetical protein n=1 Tax=Carnimonas bestiolae TaxID=3402172 RepID=UPI003F4A8975
MSKPSVDKGGGTKSHTHCMALPTIAPKLLKWVRHAAAPDLSIGLNRHKKTMFHVKHRSLDERLSRYGIA